MKAEGVTNAICVNQEVGNAGLDARCKGFGEGLGGKSTVFRSTSTTRPVRSRRSARPSSADSSINGVLALGPTGSAPALKAIQQLANEGPTLGDLRPLEGRPQRDQVRRHAVRHRSAAVPAGLPADRVPHLLQPLRPDAGRRAAGPDRPRHRRRRTTSTRSWPTRARPASATRDQIRWPSPGTACPRRSPARYEDRRCDRSGNRLPSPAAFGRESPCGLLARARVRGRVGAMPSSSSSRVPGFEVGRVPVAGRRFAGYLEVAAQVGILGATVTLLMIAGEFDLSVGSMIGALGHLARPAHEPVRRALALAIILTFVFALGSARSTAGSWSGPACRRSSSPSASLYILRGARASR